MLTYACPVWEFASERKVLNLLRPPKSSAVFVAV